MEFSMPPKSYVIGTAITFVSIAAWAVFFIADLVDAPGIGEHAALAAGVAGIVGPLVLLSSYLFARFRSADMDAPPIGAVLLAAICLGWTIFYVVVFYLAYCCCPDGLC